MVDHKQTFIQFILETVPDPLSPSDAVDKYMKRADRGMAAGESGNTVAKGVTKLAHHAEINQRKPEVISQITSLRDDRETGDKLPYGERLYVTKQQANEISSFYGFDLVSDLGRIPAQLKNSQLHMQLDTNRNLFYLIRLSTK